METQVKLYIEPDQEIRRFNLDPNATYEQLRLRVEGLLGHGNFRMLWLDSEKDFIVLGSAEELAAAKTAVKDNILRLFVRATVSAGKADKKVIHVGVTCDGCQRNLTGTRFKCMECRDYDLCEVCQTKGIHPEHDMWALRRPRSFEKEKLLIKGASSRGTRRASEQSKRELTELSQAAGESSTRFSTANLRKPDGSYADASTSPSSLLKPVNSGNFPGPFVGLSDRGPLRAGGPLGPPAFPSKFTVLTPLQLKALIRARRQVTEVSVEQPAVLEMDSLSGMVRGVRIGSQGHETAVGDEKKMSESWNQGEEGKTMEEVDLALRNRDSVSEASEESEKLESECGWTHLDAESLLKRDMKRRVKFTENEEDKKKFNVEEKALQDRRIESALRAMAEMGFPSEGVLLRRLLENYNGDMSRVLDSLE